MNKYNIITFSGLFLLIIAIPLYGRLEPQRLNQSQAELQQELVNDAAVLYVENCALCHGAAGEGIGATPALNSEVIRTADYDSLSKVIERGRYGTAMTAWHEDEGGVFNDYQIEEMVALLRYGDWSEVREIAAAQGLIPPILPVPELDEALIAQVISSNPEGSVWAEGMQLYAQNCTVCHGVNGEGSNLAVPLNTTEVRAQSSDVLARTISEGVAGTAMTGWSIVFSDDQIEALVAFLQNWDTLAADGVVLPTPEPIVIDVNNPEEMMALGERLYATTCSSCHGEEGSGGIGPVLNSQQILTRNTDEQLLSTIVNGGVRVNSQMPAFGDRFAEQELTALVDYIRSWEPTAPWVSNPRGTAQGGGPPWLRTDDGSGTGTQGQGQGSPPRATDGASGTVSPQGQGQGKQGQGRGQGGPPWATDGTTPGNSGNQNGVEGGSVTAVPNTNANPSMLFQGTVISNEGNNLTIQTGAGQTVDAMLGPPRFWSENGMALNPGDLVQFEGFESTETTSQAGTHTEINWIINLTSGENRQLRTESGMPVWAAQ